MDIGQMHSYIWGLILLALWASEANGMQLPRFQRSALAATAHGSTSQRQTAEDADKVLDTALENMTDGVDKPNGTQLSNVLQAGMSTKSSPKASTVGRSPPLNTTTAARSPLRVSLPAKTSTENHSKRLPRAPRRLISMAQGLLKDRAKAAAGLQTQGTLNAAVTPGTKTRPDRKAMQREDQLSISAFMNSDGEVATTGRALQTEGSRQDNSIVITAAGDPHRRHLVQAESKEPSVSIGEGPALTQILMLGAQDPAVTGAPVAATAAPAAAPAAPAVAPAPAVAAPAAPAVAAAPAAPAAPAAAPAAPKEADGGWGVLTWLIVIGLLAASIGGGLAALKMWEKKTASTARLANVTNDRDDVFASGSGSQTMKSYSRARGGDRGVALLSDDDSGDVRTSGGTLSSSPKRESSKYTRGRRGSVQEARDSLEVPEGAGAAAKDPKDVQDPGNRSTSAASYRSRRQAPNRKTAEDTAEVTDL